MNTEEVAACDAQDNTEHLNALKKSHLAFAVGSIQLHWQKG